MRGHKSTLHTVVWWSVHPLLFIIITSAAAADSDIYAQLRELVEVQDERVGLQGASLQGALNIDG